MNRTLKILTAALALLSAALLYSTTQAASSEHYRSHPEVLDNGSGRPGSSNHQARSCLGQEVLGLSASADHLFHAGYLYGSSAHVSPQTNKLMAIARLQRVKPKIPRKDANKVTEAIAELQKSLTSSWWVDPWHLNQAQSKTLCDGAVSDGAEGPGSLTLVNKSEENESVLLGIRYGLMVYDAEQQAALKVKELSRKQNYPPDVIAELVGVAVNILDADSTLAQVKIVEAELSGGDPGELKKAREEMKKAEGEKNKDRPEYDKAVEHYGKAWEHAVKAEEKGGGNQVQIADMSLAEPLFAMGRPYPNPARSGSCVKYGIGERCAVSLRVYDASGRVVRTLVDETKAPGYYECEWDLRDTRGDEVAAGTYIYRLTAGPFVGRNKLIVIR
jgi:hypothetical protein